MLSSVYSSITKVKEFNSIIFLGIKVEMNKNRVFKGADYEVDANAHG